MGKKSFILGGIVGFVLGSRAGRDQYEKLKSMSQELWQSDAVQAGVNKVEDTVGGATRSGASSLTDKVAGATRSGASSLTDKVAGAVKDKINTKKDSGANGTPGTGPMKPAEPSPKI